MMKNDTRTILTHEYQRCLDTLSAIPYFSTIGREDLSDLLSLFRLETWDAHSTIGSTESNSRFRIIVSGRVKLVRSHPDTAHEITLFLLGSGDLFDLTSLLTGKRYETIAVALDHLKTLSAPTDTVRGWLDRHPAAYDVFLHCLSDQMGHLMDLATDLSLYDTKTRLAKLLLRYAHGGGDQQPLSTIHDLSHEEIANLIGSVRVVVNRHIQDFKRQGIVASRRGQISVPSIPALKQCLQQA